MISLDTNVLVLAAVGDDPEQAARARNRLAALTTTEPGFITHVVMVELWWVLTASTRRKPLKRWLS